LTLGGRTPTLHTVTPVYRSWWGWRSERGGRSAALD
jgi:hypothetical protein